MLVCVYLLLVLHAADGCMLQGNLRRDDITAYAGDSVLLPCSCTDPHAKPERFIWKKRNTSSKTWDVITTECEQYRNRVQLGTVHSPGNLSLLISHLTEEDKGYYRCYLNQYYKDIRLTIKEAPYKPVNPPPVDTDTTSPTASTKPTTTVTSPNGYKTFSPSTTNGVSPQTLPYIPFALVTVIFLHIIVAVVYYTKRNKVSEMSRVHYNTAGGDGTASLQ